MNGARYITGWAQVRVTGAQPERILSALAERGIAFWDAVPPVDFSLTVKIPARAAKLIAPLSTALGCEGKVLSQHGLPAFFQKIRHRVTLLVLLFAAVVALFSSFSYVWDIEITGNETIPDGVIRQALSECGVDIGTNWTKFSQDAIRNGVILRLPGIRWMTVTMEGCRARVIVREKRVPIEPVNETEYVKLVADKAGLVTEVQALNGTAETEVGKTLLPGDTIIGGYSTGRFGVQGVTRAIGYARLRTWHEITIEAPVTVEEKTDLGRKRAGFALILGKLRINFYKGSSICPSECDKIIKRYELTKAGAFSLPIVVEKISYTRYKTQPQQATELREELEAMLSEELARRMGEDGEIVSARFTATEGDGLLYVTLHAECNERTGMAVPLDAEDIYLINSKIPKTEDTDT